MHYTCYLLDLCRLMLHRYCMIFAPFTGKDNHGRPVTFAAGLVSSEKTGAFAWLFRHFVQCMGFAPKMIVTDQDLGMRSAIEEILVGTRHRWCMWHIMHKLANKVPGRLLRDEISRKSSMPASSRICLNPTSLKKSGMEYLNVTTWKTMVG